MLKPCLLELAYRYRYRFNSASTCSSAGLPSPESRINNYSTAYSTATATIFNASGI